MSLSDYTGLKAEVADWLNKKNPELIARVPSFIELCEAQMRRELKTQNGIETIEIEADGDTYALPCDFDGLVSVSSLSGASRRLTFLPPDLFDQRNWNGRSWIGDQGWAWVSWSDCYTISGDTLYFNAGPGSVRMRYRTLFPPLSAYNRCNWLLKKHPDAYLYGSLMQAAPYLRDDERIGVWGGMYRNALDSINRQALNLQTGDLRMQSDRVV